MPKVFLNFDISTEIGLGHSRRCAVLGEALLLQGAKVAFAIRSNGIDLSEMNLPPGADVELLPWENDSSYLVDFCYRHGCMWGVVDHYRQTEQFQHNLLVAGIKWMQFYNPDLPMSYRGHLLHDATQNLELALVGREFAKKRLEAPRWDARSDILITFGGGDDRGGINAALGLIKENGGAASAPLVMTTRHNPRLDRIAGGKLMLDERHPAAIMAGCRMAICGGGTTLFELATLGVPTFIIAIADNQVRSARVWEQNRLGSYLGYLGTPLKPINKLHLADWSANCMAKVDGEGANRVAKILLETATAEVSTLQL
jgi:UDP-2,4-diacetamido-2,4,6-trideoxy-beta-L-altropyranose hydrolase